MNPSHAQPNIFPDGSSRHPPGPSSGIDNEIRRILLLYTDPYYVVKQVYPFGLDLLARFLRRYGYHVTIAYPFLPDPDPGKNLGYIVKNTRPDLVGLGIRNLDTCMSCERHGDTGDETYRTFYFLPKIQNLVHRIKAVAPGVPIVAGGGGFTVAPEALLDMLEIEYGVAGEGETALLQFVRAYPDNERVHAIPGLICRSNGTHAAHPRVTYRFEEGISPFTRDPGFNYALETMGLPIQTKRGCNQQCSYCVEPIIEGRRFVFRELEEIIRELRWVVTTHADVQSIFFVDTEFNIPDLTFCTQLIKRIIHEGLHEQLRFTSQFLPAPFDAGFAALLATAGFSVILTGDSFSDEVLKKNQISYRKVDLIRAIELCETNAIPCTIAMIFGLPGETDDTIAHSLSQINRYPAGFLRRYEYTVGGRIYQGTPLCRWVEREGSGTHLYGNQSSGYVAPYYFCSPKDPTALNRDIERGLGHGVAYENPFDDDARTALALIFMMDQKEVDRVMETFLTSPLGACARSFDYLFRQMSNGGRTSEAKTLCRHFLNALMSVEPTPQILEQIQMVQFYLGLMGS